MTLKNELDARRAQFMQTAGEQKIAAYQRGVDELEDDVANDAAYEDLKRHFSEEEIIELGMVCVRRPSAWGCSPSRWVS
jgi:hypothetical protein